MAFIRANFSPVGAQARTGSAPQVFVYTSTDRMFQVVASGYFPIDSTVPNQNMLGIFKPGDWIILNDDTVTDPGFFIIFIKNDGSDGNAITTQARSISSL